jgi:hypothetical protein
MMFVVRFISGRTANINLHTATRLFAVRFPTRTRQRQIFVVRFRRDARQSVFANTTPDVPFLLLTDVNLCRGPSQNARQRRIVCHAFCDGARQTCIFAVRFTWPHSKVFFKKCGFLHSFNFSSTNTLFCTLYFNYVIISIFLLILTNFFH